MNTRLALASSGKFEQLLQFILIHGIGEESDAEGRYDPPQSLASPAYVPHSELCCTIAWNSERGA